MAGTECANGAGEKKSPHAQASGHRAELGSAMVRLGWQVWMWTAQVTVCLWMAFGPKPGMGAQDGPRVAVLETRANQLDTHLIATDVSVQKLWDTVNTQGTTLAEMQGEERAAFAILTLLTAGNFVIQLRSRKSL